MLVDAKTLCQYHVNKLKEMDTHYQTLVQTERSRMHVSNQQLREKLETEALEFQQKVSEGTEQLVKTKLKAEIAKIEAEMTKVVTEATESRSQQKAQYDQELGRLHEELGRLREAGEQEHAARNQAEQSVRSMQEAGDRRIQELD
eukprot:5604504-Amphidinium_carterae.1